MSVGQKEEADGDGFRKKPLQGRRGLQGAFQLYLDVKEEIAGRVNRPVEVEKKEN